MSFFGLSRSIMGRVGRSAKIAGSPFEKGIASATHNGKIPGRFARTIFSTFFRMNGRRRMQVTVQVFVFLRPSAIISTSHQPMWPIGDSSRYAACLLARGVITAKTIPSSMRHGKRRRV